MSSLCASRLLCAGCMQSEGCRYVTDTGFWYPHRQSLEVMMMMMFMMIGVHVRVHGSCCSVKQARTLGRCTYIRYMDLPSQLATGTLTYLGPLGIRIGNLAWSYTGLHCPLPAEVVAKNKNIHLQLCDNDGARLLPIGKRHRFTANKGSMQLSRPAGASRHGAGWQWNG
ncbi:hypothetical protein F4808DRAFT_210609 [Astrocystis sublimbata]|nr:hypothetical protein F4808DRAFT_210609 [Astrocystis sublimbata]